MRRARLCGRIVAGAIASLALAGSVAGQQVTLSATMQPADGMIEPGETVRVDIVAEWTPAAEGLSAAFFDILDEGAFDDGTLAFSEAAGLGRHPSFRVIAGAAGTLDDADTDGDIDLAGIQVYQQAPIVNAGFNDNNPVTIYSFEWTAPLTFIDPYDVAVSLRFQAPTPTVYIDAFNTAPYAVSSPTITWHVIAPADPLDLNADGAIDFVDLGTLLAAYNSSLGQPRFNPRADISKDGRVDFPDLLFFKSLIADACPAHGTADLPPSTGMQLVLVDNSDVSPGDDARAPGFNGGVTHHTFDLRYTVGPSSDFSACTADISITDPRAAIFQHAEDSADAYSPIAAAAARFPALRYDTYVISAGNLATGIGRFPIILGNSTTQPDNVCVTWLDLEDSPAGAQTIGRLTIVTDGTVSGRVGTIAGVILSEEIAPAARRFNLDINLP